MVSSSEEDWHNAVPRPTSAGRRSSSNPAIVIILSLGLPQVFHSVDEGRPVER